MKKRLYLLTLLFSSASVFAQEFATIYQTDEELENIVVRDVVVTTENMLLAGYDIEKSGAPPTAGMMKLDIDGNVVWSNRLSIAESEAGCTFEVLENLDGNYYLWGLSKELETGNMRAILTEMTADGDILWAKEYDFGWNVEYAYTVNKLYALPSGELQMMIAVYGKVIVMQTDADGNIIWGKQSSIGPPDGGGKNPGFEWLAIPDDGGMCASKAENDFSLLRYGSDGDLIWAKRYEMGGYTHGKTIKRSPNGNILVGGFISFNPIIMEINDADGSVNWVKQLSGGVGMDYGSMAMLNVIGEDIIFDFSTSTDEHLILKMDVDGNALETYKNSTPVVDYNKIEFTDGYAGYFYGSYLTDEGQDGMIFKSDHILRESCIIDKTPSTYTTIDYLTTIYEVPFTPTQTDFTSEEEIAISTVTEPIKTKDACATFTDLAQHKEATFNLYPNPTLESVNLTVASEWVGANYQLLDLTGKAVINGIIATEKELIDVSGLSEGQYIIAITANDRVITEKLTIIK